MAKTKENLETFVDDTIGGFGRTLKVARENGWKYENLYKSLDNDFQLCYGAILFASIYEKEIDQDKVTQLRDKLLEAEQSIRCEFMEGKKSQI